MVRVYVYTPILPEDLGKFEVADTADLPEIYVMVGDAGVALLAAAPHVLNGNYLVIDKDNVGWFNGKTITGTYHPTERLTGDQKIEGGIVIDNVEVDLTIENVNISYDSIIIDDAAGILLKGNAKLNLTVKGENSLKGTYGGAGIGIGENDNPDHYKKEHRKSDRDRRRIWCGRNRRKGDGATEWRYKKL